MVSCGFNPRSTSGLQRDATGKISMSSGNEAARWQGSFAVRARVAAEAMCLLESRALSGRVQDRLQGSTLLHCDAMSGVLTQSDDGAGSRLYGLVPERLGFIWQLHFVQAKNLRTLSGSPELEKAMVEQLIKTVPVDRKDARGTDGLRSEVEAFVPRLLALVRAKYFTAQLNGKRETPDMAVSLKPVVDDAFPDSSSKKYREADGVVMKQIMRTVRLEGEAILKDTFAPPLILVKSAAVLLAILISRLVICSKFFALILNSPPTLELAAVPVM